MGKYVTSENVGEFINLISLKKCVWEGCLCLNSSVLVYSKLITREDFLVSLACREVLKAFFNCIE